MLSKTHTKYIQSLQHKKFRDESGLFIAEGPKVVLDLLESRNFICQELVALAEWFNLNNKLVSTYDAVSCIEAKDFELEKISALSTAHSVLGIFKKREQYFDIDLKKNPVLVLDTIQDPGNLGTIIRIADWFGLTHVICSEGCADMYNSKVVQSTMGSLGRVNVIYTDLTAWLQKNKQVKIYAAALNGKALSSIGKLKEGIIIIGNEAHGISDEIMALADEKITIPKMGEAESLNAAVATGIILSHVL